MPSRVHGSVLNRLGTAPSVALQLGEQVSGLQHKKRKIYNKLYLLYPKITWSRIYTITESLPYTPSISDHVHIFNKLLAVLLIFL